MSEFTIQYGILRQYVGNDETVVIPDGVTKIDKDVFSHCESLKSVMIPEGVTAIGPWAFRKCEELQTVIIPASMKKIGTCAFEGCTSLESITLPEHVQVGMYAFNLCGKIKAPVLAARQERLTQEDAIQEWLEDNMDELLDEMIKTCAYQSWLLDKPVFAEKAQRFIKEHLDDDDRYIAAYILIAAEHAQYNDPDEGYFPLDEACRLFVKHDAEDLCRELADELELDTDIETLLETIKFYMLGL